MLVPHRKLHLSGPRLEAGFGKIRAEIDVPAGFPADVESEARRLVPRHRGVDRLDIPFVTVDPAGSMDLDQAFFIEARESGHRVFYAIADVATFVPPDSLVDQAAHERGMTLYSPDHRSPLHPTPLSEGTASLLPGVERPAVLWTLDLGSDGDLEEVSVERARVMSRAQLTYEDAQRRHAAGEPLFVRLGEVGANRLARGLDRGAVHLQLPDQDVEQTGDGAYRLRYREPLAVEHWNAELSLLTGMAAARLMAAGGVGVLRTLPPASDEVVDRLRRTAAALELSWPDGATPSEVLSHLGASTPEQAALLVQAARLFRGAGYVAFRDGTPPAAGHAAIGGAYAHVTAPLRRLVDRYTTEICLALHAGSTIPSWVSERMDDLPAIMGRSGSRAGALERAVVDYVESVVLESRVGDVLTATVVDHRKDTTVLQFREPPVIGPLPGQVGDLGQQLDVRVVSVDTDARTVDFAPA